MREGSDSSSISPAFICREVGGMGLEGGGGGALGFPSKTNIPIHRPACADIGEKIKTHPTHVLGNFSEKKYWTSQCRTKF
jgi:hypothetical protein